MRVFTRRQRIGHQVSVCFIKNVINYYLPLDVLTNKIRVTVIREVRSVAEIQLKNNLTRFYNSDDKLRSFKHNEIVWILVRFNKTLIKYHNLRGAPRKALQR